MFGLQSGVNLNTTQMFDKLLGGLFDVTLDVAVSWNDLCVTRPRLCELIEEWCKELGLPYDARKNTE